VEIRHLRGKLLFRPGASSAVSWSR
jgi:hypothetical protein